MIELFTSFYWYELIIIFTGFVISLIVILDGK